MRSWLTLLVGLLPASEVKNVLLRLLGHAIGPGARIAPCLIVRSLLVVGDRSTIGTGNVFRSLVRFEMGAEAELGQLNWISAAPPLVDASTDAAAGTLVLGTRSSITNRHYFDASGGITIGEYALVAGVKSTFMTHGVDVSDNVLRTAPIVVGAFAMVASDSRLLLGAMVPEKSVVAMSSTVLKGLTRPKSLYAGNPAQWKKEVAEDAAFWTRRLGPVPVYRPDGQERTS